MESCEPNDDKHVPSFMRLVVFTLFFLFQNITYGQDGNNEPCTQAYFPGGQQALNKFLRDNIRLDSVDLYTVRGKTYVSFVVDSTGKIMDPVIKRGYDPLINIEVLRVFKMMPDWVPMVCDGKRQITRLITPVVINVQ